MSSNFFAATGVLLFRVGTQAFCGVRTHQAVHQIFGIVGDVIQPLATSTPAKPCARSSSVPATPWRRFVRGTRFTVTTPYLVGVERAVVALEVSWRQKWREQRVQTKVLEGPSVRDC
jgi:hypothetical protein